MKGKVFGDPRTCSDGRLGPRSAKAFGKQQNLDHIWPWQTGKEPLARDSLVVLQTTFLGV